MMRDDIFEYVKRKYKTEPEYPWASLPTGAVLRHKDNNKWYGLLMEVPKNKLNIEGEDNADVINIKCDPLEIDFLKQHPGFMAGYHMNKQHWLTVILDSTVSIEMIKSLIDSSYNLTKSKKKRIE